jgi:uncharacterized membrane protein YfcA
MVAGMINGTVLFVAAVFGLAGFVKGVVGLGLPTIAIGLLAVVMPPVEAAAILILPSLVTNIWQLVAGPSLAGIIRRLWPMMAGVCLGTWASMGLMTGAPARYGGAFLGVALVIYALTGLAQLRLHVMPRHEGWLGPLVGAITGAVTSATGVFVIPAVPYLQAIGMEKEDLVQALGLSFTVSTLALAVNIVAIGGLNADMAGSTVAALVLACAGMWVGQELRLRLEPATFRRWFLIGLAVLGVYLTLRATL